MRVRRVAWALIIAAAALEAYGQRFALSPDGMSYLDLSDALVQGRWSGLVSAYWSPLYPVLIGIVRLATGVGPQRELVAVHALNFVLFIGMVAAFDWMLTGLVARARRWPRSVLQSRWGVIGAYVVFGSVALVMTPIELTTPDLIVAALVFVVFGAGLRLAAGADPLRNAVLIGAALGVGALAKSFIVPWSVVYLVVLAAATVPRVGPRPATLAAGVGLAIVLPWCVVLSRTAGHVMFGDAGRLTYAWFVNDQETPYRGAMPSAARAPDVDSILPGVAVVDGAPGTNPIWFDPARWSGGLNHIGL